MRRALARSLQWRLSEVMTMTTLNETAKRILSEVQPIDTADVLADVVLRAEDILRDAAYRLLGESPTPEQMRRLLNAVGAQWTR